MNGPAVTGGPELALACDFLVPSERAGLVDAHARVGVMPGRGLTVALPEAVGLRRAREMNATGNFIGARTALEWGLVNHVVPHEELIGFTRKLAAGIASADPAAARATFGTYDQAAQIAGGPARQVEARAHAKWHAEGIDAGQVASRREAVIRRCRSQM